MVATSPGVVDCRETLLVRVCLSWRLEQEAIYARRQAGAFSVALRYLPLFGHRQRSRSRAMANKSQRTDYETAKRGGPLTDAQGVAVTEPAEGRRVPRH